MRESFGVGSTLCDRKLRRSFVELRGHLARFVRRTAEGDEQLRELLEFVFGHSNQFNHGWVRMDTDKNRRENSQRPVWSASAKPLSRNYRMCE
jgi:hypothetical protein